MHSFKLLRALAPHLNAHRGRLFVVKLGGELLEPGPARDQLIAQLNVLHSCGIRLVLVHGGAPQIAAACARLGLPVELVNGRRVTSPAVLEAVSMVLPGSLQSALLAALRAGGVPGVGLNGAAAGIVDARRRPPLEQVVDGAPVLVDYGLAGEIAGIDPGPLRALLDAGYVPVLAPLASSEDGELLNINADTVASRLACALGAHKLIFLLRPPGILADAADPATLLPELSAAQLAELEHDGTLSAGMLPKAAAARSALAGGVPRIHFVSGVNEDALLHELFSNEGSGTLVTGDV